MSQTLGFSSETDLCAAYASHMRSRGFKIYPEHQGWDMVLRRGKSIIGVQAKLKLDYHALAQSLMNNVNYRVVLFHNCPGGKEQMKYLIDYTAIARQCKTVVVRGVNNGELVSFTISNQWRIGDWARKYRHKPLKGMWFPDVEPDLPAGVPAPISVSPFVVMSLNLEKLHDEKGYITTTDVRKLCSDNGFDWSPGRLMNHMYRCTHTKPPEGGRASMWVKTVSAKKYFSIHAKAIGFE